MCLIKDGRIVWTGCRLSTPTPLIPSLGSTFSVPFEWEKGRFGAVENRRSTWKQYPLPFTWVSRPSRGAGWGFRLRGQQQGWVRWPGPPFHLPVGVWPWMWYSASWPSFWPELGSSCLQSSKAGLDTGSQWRKGEHFSQDPAGRVDLLCSKDLNSQWFSSEGFKGSVWNENAAVKSLQSCATP